LHSNIVQISVSKELTYTVPNEYIVLVQLWFILQHCQCSRLLSVNGRMTGE